MLEDNEKMIKSKYFKSARNKLHECDWQEERKTLVEEIIEELGDETDGG